MSMSALTWAYKIVRDIDVFPGELLVLYALAWHSSEGEGYLAWPSQETIAAETKQTDRHVRNCLSALIEKRLIREARHPYDARRKAYQLAVKLYARQEFTEPSSGEEITSGEEYRNPTSGDTGTPVPVNTGTPLPVEGSASIYEPTEEPTENLQPELHSVSKESQIGVRKPKERFKPRYPSRSNERPPPATVSRPKIPQETLDWLAKLSVIFSEVDPSSAKREVGLLQPNAALRELILRDVLNRSKAPTWLQDKPEMFFYFREKTWEVPYNLEWKMSCEGIWWSKEVTPGTVGDV